MTVTLKVYYHEGVKATCSKCGHTWYINKKIHTCKCLTCSAAKGKPQEVELVERGGMMNFEHKNDGPFWTRTRDFSLIRNGDYSKKASTPANLRDYIDLWYSEQKLKGIGDITVYGYRQKVEALLNEHPRAG